MTHTSDGIEIAVLRSLCKRFKTELSRSCMSISGQQYLKLEIDPTTYKDSDFLKFSKDLLIYSLLRKWKGWDVGIDTHEVALGAWISAEQRCYSTNRFLNDTAHPYGALAFFSKVQRKIEHVIGKWPPDDIFDLCRWSSGATANLKREHSDVSEKVSRVITVTRPALKHLMSVMDTEWLKALPAVPYRIVGSNRGVMVPKNAKTDRPIAAEPTGNAFLQQGVGQFIRRKLKAFGVNLSDQTVNQDAAFRALVDGLATVDLSSASDTLCISTVRLFLPAAWFDLLSDLRSPKTVFGGKTYHLDKFSSMGNAFTFELESLIFWAIARVVTDETDPGGFCTVYGDDIILPQCSYPLLARALDYCGFLINHEKSYKDGVFFESCGKQYFTLEDVTPVFQKEVVGTNLQELIRLHNRLYRWGLRNGMHLVKDTLKLVNNFTVEAHPRLKHRPEIPEGHPGDMGFLSPNCKRRKDGDYDCNVIVETPQAIGLIWPNVERGLFAYTLRRNELAGSTGSGLNTLENGHTGKNVGTATRLVRTRIWASSLQS